MAGSAACSRSAPAFIPTRRSAWGRWVPWSAAAAPSCSSATSSRRCSILCPTSLLLEGGRLVRQGETRAVIDEYLARQRTLMNTPLGQRSDRQGKKRFRFTDCWFEDMEGQRLASVMAGQAVKLVMTYENCVRGHYPPPAHLPRPVYGPGRPGDAVFQSCERRHVRRHFWSSTAGRCAAIEPV